MKANLVLNPFCAFHKSLYLDAHRPAMTIRTTVAWIPISDLDSLGFRVSSSFVVGNEYTMDPGYYESDYIGEYIDLSEISSSQLGTIYPPYPVDHWDAITI